MAIQLKVIQSTVFKQTTAQAAQLAAQDKVSVPAGQSFAVQAWKVISQNYISVTLLQAVLGNPPRNTWYVYVPDIQLLQSPSLKVIQSTVFKQSTANSSEVTAPYKVNVAAGQSFDLQSWATANNNHYKITLASGFLGNPPRNTWYVYGPHVQFINQQPQTIALNQPTLLTIDQLYNICLVATKDDLQPFLAVLNQYWDQSHINTPLRLCHYLAQVLHESGEFQYLEELADGSEYEGRTDLGNTHPGDGVKYKGSGIIQITGLTNFTQMSKDLGFDFVNHPEAARVLPWAVLTSFWFFNRNGIPPLADQDNGANEEAILEQITQIVNGGLNGLDDRRGYLQRAKQVIGA